MKKLKLISLLLAVVMLGAGLISCGGAVVSAKVRLAVIKINANGSKDLICGVMEATVKGTENDPPTVLQATREILEENSIQYTVDDSEGGRITSIKNQKERSSGGMVSGWIFKLNGEDATDLASRTVVHDGDHIVYYLDMWKNDQAVDDPDATDETETEAESETEIETEEESEDDGE